MPQERGIRTADAGEPGCPLLCGCPVPENRAAVVCVSCGDGGWSWKIM
ncbi:MAG: hypothetical protein HFH95_12450 [Lachnospiraceae bacterium]|nr:hypothetical protein [Lachnospiraceae bacterium]